MFEELDLFCQQLGVLECVECWVFESITESNDVSVVIQSVFLSSSSEPIC